LTELGQTEDGGLVQRKILTALCKLRNLPDPNVPDKDAGLDALRNLKSLALEHHLVAHDEIRKETDRKRLAEEREKILRERAAKLDTLREKFSAAITNPDRQRAGYSLENLLKELFLLFEINYRKSFRITTQQIDGHFTFEGFDYLVEARWREDQPTEQEIGAFKHKVDTKLESTRGLFVSIVGFRDEVIEQFNSRGANIILMDGRDLMFILEGRIDLRDALLMKIAKAAQEGLVFTSFDRGMT
jgi:hypothetical protein